MIRACLAIAVALGGCGRIGFDGTSAAGDGGGDGPPDGIDASKAAGPRWMRAFGDADPGDLFGVMVAGTGGEVVAVKNFQTSLTVEGSSFAGQSPFGSVAVARYDAMGAIVSQAVLDATGYCEARGVTMAGDDALVTGFTIGTTAMASYGACSLATNRQDPVALRIDRAGQQTLVAHWIAGGGNGQGWRGAAFPDGTFAMSGIYSINLTVGTPLAAAVSDPTAFLVRYAATSAPRWTKTGAPANAVTQPGGLAADGDELCAMGSFDGPITLFGTALPYQGNTDVWVARFDANGTPRFVRAIGSTGLESSFGNGSITVGPNGGCIVSLQADGDVTIDALSLPRSSGAALIVQFAGDGSVVAGSRIGTAPRLARLGTRVLAAATVSGTISLPSGPYVAEGDDVLIGEIDPGGAVSLYAVLGGGGDQKVTSFAAIGDDALAIGASSTGDLVFGSMMSSSAGTVHVVAVVGL